MSDPLHRETGARAQPEGVASRVAAYRVLRRVHEDQAWSGPALDGVLRNSDLGARDRSFAANLAYATLRWEGTLDWALGHALNRPLAEVEPDVLDVLRLGAWQLLYGDAPDRAAVGTAVDVARDEIGPHVTGFVNGVLRGLARQQAALRWPAEHTSAGLGLRTGYPEWVVEAARERFGGRAEAVLAAGNVPAGITLRALGDRDALLDELHAAGVDAQPGAVPEAVRVADASTLGPVGDVPAIAQGRAVVQDEASMVVVRAAAEGQPSGGWSAVDLCAAPGGKSTFLAQLGARVTANDVLPSRSRLIEAAAARTGFADRIEVTTADARTPPYPRDAFDVVLLDAPCSGLGVVRRRPELRWRREAGDAARLAALQTELLDAAADLVRPGGTLLYSVCTWTAAETTGVLRPFLALNGDRVEVAETDTAGLGTSPPGDPGVQLDPDHDGTDGMYLCRMRRLQ